MTWQEWYFARAAAVPNASTKKLFWDEIKPGCSRKQLEVIAKVVLDRDDPTQVDWTLIRAGHLFLKHDLLSDRARLAAMSNLNRLTGQGVVRKTSEWYKSFSGWKKKTKKDVAAKVVTSDMFANIVDEATRNLSVHDGVAVKALLTLSYYCGLKVSQVGRLRQDDFILSDGRTFLYSAGRFIDLPDHVVRPLTMWLRTRKLGHNAGKNPIVFRIEHRRILSKYPYLHETYTTLRRMRG